MITISSFTDVYLVFDMTSTYVGVCSILGSYLLQSIPHLFLMLYQSVSHVVVETLLYFSHFLLIVLLMDIVYFHHSL